MSEENNKTQSGGSYNTTDLAADLSKTFGMPKAQALRVVNAACTLIANAVSRDDVVRLHQFGNFKRLETQARKGRNPRTGEETTIEASCRPHFVAAQAFKDQVKAGEQRSLEDIQQSAPAQPAKKQQSAAPAKKAAQPRKPAKKQQSAAPAKKAAQPRKPIARKQAPQPAPPIPTEEAAPTDSAIDEL